MKESYKSCLRYREQQFSTLTWKILLKNLTTLRLSKWSTIALPVGHKKLWMAVVCVLRYTLRLGDVYYRYSCLYCKHCHKWLLRCARFAFICVTNETIATFQETKIESAPTSAQNVVLEEILNPRNNFLDIQKSKPLHGNDKFVNRPSFHVSYDDVKST